MALSGSFTTSAYSNRSLTFSWSARQSISGNYSTISWSLVGSGSQSQYFKSAPFTVVIDGEQVYYSDTRIQLYNGTTVASGTKTIYHNADGSRSFSASVSAAIYSYALNVSGSGSWSLDNIPRQANISTAPNFNDEGNPAITYSNPAGTAVTSLDACISLTGSKDDVPYRAISKTGTSYTFNLTDAERNTLRNACTTANSRTVKFYVRTVVGGTTFYSILDRTLTIVNANPTFTAAAADTMAHSIELTGDSSKLIKGYNTVAASITAAAYKGATISSYKIVNGGTTINSSSGTFTNAENGSFSFEVTDSRGNKATSSITLDMVNYIPLTVNVDGKVVLSSVDSTKADVSFTVNGNYFNGTFGAVANTLTGSYIVEANDGEKIEAPLDIPAEAMSNGTYKVSVTIPNLDYRKTYVVSVIYSDAIYSNLMAVSKTLRATPVFDWGEEDFNFNVPVTIQGGRCYSEFILFDGVSNTAITLSDSVDNYDYIEIFYQDNNGEVGGYTKLYKPNGKTIDIDIVEAAESIQTTYVRRTFYKVSGNTITPDITGAGYVLFQNSSLSHTIGTNYIYITRVVGLK